MSIGTVPILWAVKYVNINAKVTAVTVGNFDFSIDGGAGSMNRAFLGVPVKLTSFPMDFTTSYILSDAFSVHAGLGVQNIEVKASLPLSDFAEAIAVIAGVDLSDDLLASVDNGQALYGGGHLTLLQPHFAMDARFNRRDSLIYQWRGTTWMSARIDAGVETGDGVAIGAAVAIRKALGETAIGTHSLSWQFSGEHAHLRLGLGASKPYGAGLGLLQANELYFAF